MHLDHRGRRNRRPQRIQKPLYVAGCQLVELDTTEGGHQVGPDDLSVAGQRRRPGAVVRLHVAQPFLKPSADCSRRRGQVDTQLHLPTQVIPLADSR
jgi:hypothetical protein